MELKKEFETECKFQAKFQKWIVHEKEIEGEATTFEDIGDDLMNFRVDIEEIPNLEYYGFSQVTPIKAESFRQFYVENDEDFLKAINQGNFPSSAFEHTFRVMVLGIIFSAVKKHCRIESATTVIRQLVESSSKPSMLWQAKSPKERSFFNEHYALHNILHSGDDDLKIEFMRIYKGHSPIPLISKDSDNVSIPFYEHHFWISNKSFTVVSFAVTESITGKSTLLNRMFGTDFETNSKRHPICNNSVYIQYNVYRNDNLLVDLIDISNQSLLTGQKAELCRAANLLIVHYTHANLEETKEWVRSNCRDVPIIFIERDSNLMDVPSNFLSLLQSNQSKDTDLYFGIPELDEDNLRFFSNNLNLVSDQIHSFIRDKAKDKTGDESQWRFMEFLSSKGKTGSLSLFTRVLRDIEENFSDIVPTDAFIGIEDTKVEAPSSPTLRAIVNVMEMENIDRAMSKLRETIRLMRVNRLSVFSEISEIEKQLESQNDETIKGVF